jgi:hypothetical protein
MGWVSGIFAAALAYRLVSLCKKYKMLKFSLCKKYIYGLFLLVGKLKKILQF